ncbi:hypothetical protein [Desulforhopalus sp. IMCC35007]|uniref:hypothetical protein n=1 Tax=Desulforhopalus sp. IMCC35007 TaxID=2569543 RepID=UPI0010ADBC71|nr:hypothetical protein [Desulforhopalus sp. IMCC35007]TKB09606.1 hypothetical protein FCL48_09145 [Desulforhopalus sp. IMCC35007]
MTQYICPSCGSKYFMTSKTREKIIFQVTDGRSVEFVEMTTEEINNIVIDAHNICCGACSWQGSLDEVVESHRD